MPSTRSSCGGCQRRSFQRTLYYRQVPAAVHPSRRSRHRVPNPRRELFRESGVLRTGSWRRRGAPRAPLIARVCQACNSTYGPEQSVSAGVNQVQSRQPVPKRRLGAPRKPCDAVLPAPSPAFEIHRSHAHPSASPTPGLRDPHLPPKWRLETRVLANARHPFCPRRTDRAPHPTCTSLF